ncbi:protein of unknown function [bacterium A37T11]|nr:protein of unknown function [bacterium A37T11]
MKHLFFSISLFLATASAYAHSLWIESPAKASINEKIPVNICFGVFDTGEREIIGKDSSRWSEVDKFRAWVISPSGQRINLSFTEAGDHYQAFFIPSEKGTYVIQLENKVREVADWTDTKNKIGIVKQNFYSRTQIQVGNEDKVNEYALHPDLNIIPSSSDKQQIALQVIFRGKPVPNSSVILRFPGKADREVKTDVNGKAVFKGLEDQGRYFLLCLLRFDVPGEYNGVHYDAVREKATATVFVLK